MKLDLNIAEAIQRATNALIAIADPQHAYGREYWQPQAEEILNNALMAQYQHCTFPGCTGTFHPEDVRDPGPHNDPPGRTGWRFAANEDPSIPAHDHSTTDDFSGHASVQPHNLPGWDGTVYVVATINDVDSATSDARGEAVLATAYTPPEHIVKNAITDLEILDRAPGWNLSAHRQLAFVGNINGGDSVPYYPTSKEAQSDDVS